MVRISIDCAHVSSGSRLLRSSSSCTTSGPLYLRASGRLYSLICFSSCRCTTLATPASFLAAASIGSSARMCWRICHSGHATNMTISARHSPNSAGVIQPRGLFVSSAAACAVLSKSSSESTSDGDRSIRVTLMFLRFASASIGSTRIRGAAASSTVQVPAERFLSLTRKS